MSDWTGNHTKKALVCAGAIIALVMAIQASGMNERQASAGKRLPGALGTPVRITLHGSTPTMAWSPDSKRLAVNSAFEYYGFRRQLLKYRKHLGVYVVDLARRKTIRVTPNQGYHPLWLSKTRLAWGHSPYEAGKPGLFLASVTKRAGRVKRLGTYKGVYTTLLAKNGNILFYSGFPEYKRWVYANPRTGAVRATGQGGTSFGAGWSPPKALWKSQCLQKVGKTVASVNATTTRYLLKTANKSLLLPGKPYRYRSAGAMGCRTTGTCGGVLPCVAPNGKRVAYFTQTATTGVFQLNVQQVR